MCLPASKTPRLFVLLDSEPRLRVFVPVKKCNSVVGHDLDLAGSCKLVLYSSNHEEHVIATNFIVCAPVQAGTQGAEEEARLQLKLEYISGDATQEMSDPKLGRQLLLPLQLRILPSVQVQSSEPGGQLCMH